VNSAREDLKDFLNEESKKNGFGADVFLCLLYEAAYVFENVKEDVKKTGKDEGVGLDKYLDTIKEKALKNVNVRGN
jgi:hypothetical protein